jgi:hypothetical protein
MKETMLLDLHLQVIFLPSWPDLSRVSNSILERILLCFAVYFQFNGCDLCPAIDIHFVNMIYFFDIVELELKKTTLTQMSRMSFYEEMVPSQILKAVVVVGSHQYCFQSDVSLTVLAVVCWDSHQVAA